MTGKPIGQLNGPWALLLKIVLVLVPIIATCSIPWIQWQTKEGYASEETRIIVTRLVESVEAINEKFAELPPPEWKERVKILEMDARRNLEDHSDIKVSLEQIKAKLGVAPVPRSDLGAN